MSRQLALTPLTRVGHRLTSSYASHPTIGSYPSPSLSRSPQHTQFSSQPSNFEGASAAEHQVHPAAPSSEDSADGAGKSKQEASSDQRAEQAEHRNTKAKKSVTQMDEELKARMEGLAGDGGASGVEYEGGKAEGLKRGVKENMFRYI